MLVLGRKQFETILCTVMEPIPVGTEIEITMCDSVPDHARIGVTAPKSIQILRGELVDEKPRRNVV